MSMPGNRFALGLLLLVFAIATFQMSAGLFTIDEFLSYAGADAFWHTGGFAIDNAIPGVVSSQLKPMLMVAGPNGIVPQYPPGMAVVGAPLLALFGMHGMMLLNALAAAVTVWLLWRMAARHFGGAGVALGACALLLGASFFLEYAFAVWPHAVSVMCVTGALLLTLDSIADGTDRARRALAIGALVGLGLLFRTDTILAVPALGMALFLLADRPFYRLTLVGAGFAPFVLAASLANLIKFGTLNPVSYGQSVAGGTNPASHLLEMLALVAAGAVALAGRLAWDRHGHKVTNRGALLWIAGALVVIGAVIAHGLVWRYLHGFWALVVDATQVQAMQPGMQHLPNGTLSYWGFWKKALGQSMPWLGVLLAGVWAGRWIDRRIWITVALLAFVWTLPFFPKDWHGGMGINMRYFLPLLPVGAACAAALTAELGRTMRGMKRKLLTGAALGVAAHFAWIEWASTGVAGANQILPTWLFLATAALAGLAGLRWRGQRWIRTLAMLAIGAGVGMAAMLGKGDLHESQRTRDRATVLSHEYGQMPGRAVAFVPAPFLVGWALQPGHVLAARNIGTGKFDYVLIGQAIDRGYRVYIWPRFVTHALIAQPGFRLERAGLSSGRAELFELVRDDGKRDSETVD